jgi:hypothetical protein
MPDADRFELKTNPSEKNILLRRTLIGLLLCACVALAALFIYLRMLPEITVINRGDEVIEEAVVELPSSRVVFDAIAPGEQSTIFYSVRQADGAYRYTIRYGGYPEQVGQCGYVTGAEFGKRLVLIVSTVTPVECQESQGLL